MTRKEIIYCIISVSLLITILAVLFGFSLGRDYEQTKAFRIKSVSQDTILTDKPHDCYTYKRKLEEAVYKHLDSLTIEKTYFSTIRDTIYIKR